MSGSGFFDEDVDYSTDIEGESLDDRSDITEENDDDLTDEEIIDKIRERHPENVPIAKPSQDSLSDDDDDDDEESSPEETSKEQVPEPTQEDITNVELETALGAAKEAYPDASGFDVRELSDNDFAITIRQDGQEFTRTLDLSGQQDEIRRAAERRERELAQRRRGELTAEERNDVERQLEARLRDEGVDVNVREGDYTVTVDENGNITARLSPQLRNRLRRSRVEEIERSLERQVGEERADLLAEPFGQAAAPAEPVDLEEGRDYELTVTQEETAEGVEFNWTAELTGQFRREFSTEVGTRQLEKELLAEGIDVDLTSEDVEVDEEGNISLTESGRKKASGDEFEQDVISVPVFERESFETTVTGPEGTEQKTTKRVTGIGFRPLEDVAREASRAYSEFSRPASETIAGGLTLQGRVGLLTRANEIESPSDAARVLRDESSATPRIEGIVEGVLNVPAIPLGVAIAAEEVGEFGLAAYDVYEEEGLGITYDTTRTRTNPLGQEVSAPVQTTDEGAASFVAEETGETAGEQIEQLETEISEPRGQGRLAGSLLGTAAVFGAAAAVGPRTGLTARAAIQPGEEVLGYGGYGLTRRVAGRGAAERYFPQQEPLIFSEEFAIRQLRRGGRRARRSIETGRRFSRGEFEIEDLPISTRIEAFERFRPGGPTRIAGEETLQPAGRSEPLGSITEFDPRTRRFQTEPEESDPFEPPDGGFVPSPELREFIAETGQRQRDARIFGEMADELGVDARAMTEGGARTLKSELDFREGPAIYGGAERRLRRAQETLEEQAELEREAEREQFADFSVEAEVERVEASQRPFTAETETEAEQEIQSIRTELDVRSSLRDALGRTSITAEAERSLEIPRLDTELENETDQEIETELETELETEAEAEVEAEAEAEAELEFEFEIEPEAEVELLPRRRRQEEEEGIREFRFEAEPAVDADQLSVGWLAETFTGFAGIGEGAIRRTTRAELEAQDEQPFGELLPSFSEEEAEAFADVQEFFTGSPDDDLDADFGVGL